MAAMRRFATLSGLLLATKVPTGVAHACTATWGECTSSACCSTPGVTCYAKDPTYAQCQPTGQCEPGLHPGDPVQSPWSCAPLSPAEPPTTAAALPTTAPAASTEPPTTATPPATTAMATTIGEPAASTTEALTTAAPTPATSAAGSPLGTMTVWTDADTSVVSSACGYAGSAIGGLQSALAKHTAYLPAKAYCGVSPDLFAGGARCGACYRLWHADDKEGGVVVQVVNANDLGTRTLNCHPSVFERVSGLRSGSAAVGLEQVACDTGGQGPLAALVSGNAYYSKVVFGNLPHPVRAAELVHGHRRVAMGRVQGTAQWEVEHGPLAGAVSFALTTAGGELLLERCFPSLPAHPGSTCPATASAADGMAVAEAATAVAGCVGTWQECTTTRCCSTPGTTCYEKDFTYAQCQPTGHCTPGFHARDPVQSPWSCIPLSPPAPTTGAVMPPVLVTTQQEVPATSASPVETPAPRTSDAQAVTTAPTPAAPSTTTPPATTAATTTTSKPPATTQGPVRGHMTVWTDSDDDVVGAACGYAGAEIGGLASPPGTHSSYLPVHAYCGASPNLFAGGAGCGACYRFWHPAGPAEGAVAQVVNANDMGPNTFNCHLSFVRRVAGNAPGSTAVRFTPVACDTGSSGPLATVVSANDYYMKAIFANLPFSLRTAELLDGARAVPMRRVADTAQWAAQHGLLSDAVDFRLTTSDGSQLRIQGCFADSPAAPGTYCRTATSAAATGGAHLRGAAAGGL